MTFRPLNFVFNAIQPKNGDDHGVTGLFAGMVLVATLCGGCQKPAAPVAKPVANEPKESFQLEEGYRGISLADFQYFPAELSASWKETDGAISCSGKPKGYAYTNDTFENFTLRFETRFVRPENYQDDQPFAGNTGVLVFLSGEHKIWPLSLEVQGKYSELGRIKENGGAEVPTIKDDDETRKKVRKPVGEWNQIEIVSSGGALTVKLNDTVVCASEPNFLEVGLIGFQAEGFPYEIRRLRVKNQ